MNSVYNLFRFGGFLRQRVIWVGLAAAAAGPTTGPAADRSIPDVRQSELTDDIKQGNIRNIKRQLETSGQSPCAALTASDRAVLSLASEANQLHIVRWALEHCETPACVNAQDAHGFCALQYAAWKGHDKVVAVLLDHGAKPDLADIYGLRPVHKAVAFGRLTTLKLMLTAHPELINTPTAAVTAPHTYEAQPSAFETCLHLAARLQRPEELQLLLLFGAGTTATPAIINCTCDFTEWLACLAVVLQTSLPKMYRATRLCTISAGLEIASYSSSYTRRYLALRIDI